MYYISIRLAFLSFVNILTYSRGRKSKQQKKVDDELKKYIFFFVLVDELFFIVKYEKVHSRPVDVSPLMMLLR